MGNYKELYKSAAAKDEDGKLLCIMQETMEKLERENPSLYQHVIDGFEKLAYSITKNDAERIVRNMRPRGQQWTYSQVEELCKSKNIEGHTTDFYLVMNMVYNDYYNTAAIYGLQKDEEFFFSLAKDFIFDQDAKPHKVAKYFME